MFSINPLYPDRVTGGASKNLFSIACHLGSLCHQVDILCAKTKNSLAQFELCDGVTVYSILPFHLPFPQPYAIGGPELALIAARISEALKNADRFYIHDGEWLIPDVYQEIPTTISFRDNIYPESVLGSFIGKADDVICVSAYSRSVIEYTAGQFFPGLRERIHLVNNGIDLDQFQPSPNADLAKELGLDPQHQFILLHPHRPEPGKGLSETIRVANRLVHRHGVQNLRVLIPEWIGEMVSDGEINFYNRMKQMMVDLDVVDHIQFIRWMRIDEMPKFYSLADVTLCLGNIVEAFGNVAYESLACGTPSIVARAGVHRTLLPEELVDKVHYGDIDDAVQRVMAYFKGKKKPLKPIRAYLKSELNYDKQVESYARIISQSQKREQLKFSPLQPALNQAFMLAPWCYFDGERIYHDFRGGFENSKILAKLINDKEKFTKQEAIQTGVSSELCNEWIELTYIVPVPDLD